MKSLLKFMFGIIKVLLLLAVIAAIIGVIGSLISKKKFESMSDDEIREFLAAKLDGKVAEDQLASIQDAVIAGVRARRGQSEDHYVEDVKEAVEELTEVAEDVAEAAEDAAETAVEAAEDASDAAEEAEEAAEEAEKAVEEA